MVIYLITNKVNGKQYVGQTTQSLFRRWHLHCSKSGRCLAMKSAIRKYGKENFSIKSIYVASCLEELNQMEREFINKYNTLFPNGYNLTIGGSSRTVFSEETRKRMSDAKIGHIPWNKGLTKEDPRVVSYIRSGTKSHAYGKAYHSRPHSEETKIKISKSNTGRKLKEELRKNFIKSRHRISIRCIENGKIYVSIKEASLHLSILESGISNVLAKRRKTVGGYTFSRISK